MKTFFIWMGFLSCSILGGYAHTELEGVGKIILFSSVVCLSIILLLLHNRLSKKMEMNNKTLQIFRATSIIGILVCIGLFITKKDEYSESVRVATLMLTVLCTVSACYESRYTAE